MSTANLSDKPSASRAGTVLIVDDVPVNLHVLADVLRGDYHVKVATNGATALTIAAGTPSPDIILLDVMMPDMDGYEVCRRLKAEPATADIPVIFVTARGEEEDESKGFQVGAVDYVTKPVRPLLVLQRVRTQLALKHARDTLLAQNQAMEAAARLRDDVERITRHDLKNPLVTIIGMAEVLLDESALSADDHEYAKAIHRSAHTLLQMVNLSLDMYKMETGRYRLLPAPMDMLGLARQVAREQELVWKNRGCLVTVNGVSPEDGTRVGILAERLLCYSMLTNLVHNACEASPPGNNVTIDLEPRSDRLMMTIVNPGKVPEEIRPVFFDKYITHGKSHGTGLGTYSARLIARTHGGEIFLDTSRPGLVRLVITLPITQGKAGENPV